MKKTFLLLAALCLFFSCGNKQQKPVNTVDPDTITETTVDTITEEPTTEEQPSFFVDTYKIQDAKPTSIDGEETPENLMTFECEIDIPVTDNQALYDSICYWVAQCFGSSYDGDPRDLKAMMNFYKDWALETDEEVEDTEGFDLSYTFKMLDANDHYVTYRHYSFFESISSPRANQEDTYVTFNTQTGQRFNRQMVNVDEDLKQLVMEALFKQYFSDWSDEVLDDLLFFDPELPEDYGFFLPQYTEPYLLNNDLYFYYTQHEIADRCTGQPQCALDYNVVEPYLTEEGRGFFDKR